MLSEARVTAAHMDKVRVVRLSAGLAKGEPHMPDVPAVTGVPAAQYVRMSTDQQR